MKKLVSTFILVTLIATTALTHQVEAAPKNVKITYVENGAKKVKDQSVKKNTNPKEPKVTRTGYAFSGWYTDKKLKKKWNTKSSKVTKNTTLYAKWQKQLKVTYIENGGKTVKDQYVNKNISPCEQKTTRYGYTFSGWYTNKSLTNKWNKSSKITKNTTLYAKWTPNKYTVTYNTKGGNSLTSTKVNYNTNISEPTPKRVGYTFSGWYVDTNCTKTWDNKNGKITKNITLYAKWTPNKYTVTYNTKGGNSLASIKVNYNTTVSEPTPKRVGYKFLGWYTDTNCTKAWNNNSKVTNNITLYAKWEQNKYTVTYDTKDENTTSIKVNHGESIIVPTPKRDGYTFYGWYTDTNYTKVWDNSKVTNNITLYAKWELNKYTVTYDTKDGNTTTIEVNHGENIIVPTPKRDGYKFIAWYTNDDFTEVFNGENIEVTSNITLYAKWEELSPDFIIEDSVLKKYIGTSNEVIIPDGVTTIGTGAFYDNQNITSVTLPSTVKAIEDFAFYNAIKLEYINIPNGVEVIGVSAFCCTSLVNVDLPKSIKTIENFAFSNTPLIDVDIPQGTTTIGDEAFYGTTISEFDIPNSVTSIGPYAFGCHEPILYIANNEYAVSWAKSYGYKFYYNGSLYEKSQVAKKANVTKNTKEVVEQSEEIKPEDSYKVYTEPSDNIESIAQDVSLKPNNEEKVNDTTINNEETNNEKTNNEETSNEKPNINENNEVNIEQFSMQ